MQCQFPVLCPGCPDRLWTFYPHLLIKICLPEVSHRNLSFQFHLISPCETCRVAGFTTLWKQSSVGSVLQMCVSGVNGFREQGTQFIFPNGDFTETMRQGWSENSSKSKESSRSPVWFSRKKIPRSTQMELQLCAVPSKTSLPRSESRRWNQFHRFPTFLVFEKKTKILHDPKPNSEWTNTQTKLQLGSKIIVKGKSIAVTGLFTSLLCAWFSARTCSFVQVHAPCSFQLCVHSCHQLRAVCICPHLHTLCKVGQPSFLSFCVMWQMFSAWAWPKLQSTVKGPDSVLWVLRAPASPLQLSGYLCCLVCNFTLLFCFTALCVLHAARPVLYPHCPHRFFNSDFHNKNRGRDRFSVLATRTHAHTTRTCPDIKRCLENVLWRISTLAVDFQQWH